MQVKKDNPFTLTFGRKPNEYINRYESLDAIVSTFEAENPVSQAIMIEGVRGSGKTVLMTAAQKELAEKKDWVTVDLNSTENLIEDLAMRLSNEFKRPTSAIKSGFSVSVGGFGVGINGGEAPNEIGIIEEMLRHLADKKKKLLITIDEVQHNKYMRSFASEFQILIRKNYPVYLLMTGLYENIYAIQNDPALTFLLRTPKIVLEPLSINQITKQYKRIFDTDDETARRLAIITKGYAFAFQALGLLYYEYRDELPFERILSDFDDMLDDFVYKKIWESMSDQDKKIALAIGENTAKVQSVCEKVGMNSTSFSKYRDRLIKRGIIESSKHGYVSLALPRFANIITSYT